MKFIIINSIYGHIDLVPIVNVIKFHARQVHNKPIMKVLLTDGQELAMKEVDRLIWEQFKRNPATRALYMMAKDNILNEPKPMKDAEFQKYIDGIEARREQKKEAKQQIKTQGLDALTAHLDKKSGMAKFLKGNKEQKKPEKDEFGPLKGTESWEKLGRGEKAAITRKRNEKNDK